MSIAFFVTGLLLASDPGATDGPPPSRAGARYDLPVRIVFPPTPAGVYFYSPSPGGGPHAQPARIAVGEQGRSAFEAAVSRLFRPSEQDPAATLEVRVEQAEVDLDRSGWFAYVDYDLALRDAAGSDLGRWRVRGEGRILGHGSSVVHRAFAAASVRAAAVFEAELARPEAVAAWIRSAGLVPRDPPPGPPREPPPPIPVPAARSERLVFAELTGGLVEVAQGGRSSTLGARVGRSGRRLVGQAAVDVWPLEFVTTPPAAWGSTRAKVVSLAAGGDVALRLAIGSSLELHGGVGGRLTWGRATAEYRPLAAPTSVKTATEEDVVLTGAVFAAARWVGTVPRLGVRYRIGLEVRRAFGATLGLPTLGASGVEIAGLGASLLVGIELPAGRGRATAPAP